MQTKSKNRKRPFRKFKSRPKASRPNKSRNKDQKKGLQMDANDILGSKKQEGAKQYESKIQFADLQLHPALLKEVAKKGYSKPSEIQEKAIPSMLAGDSVIGVAGTGTGKTAAFLLPILHNLLGTKKDNYALILSPTRELASQINNEFRSLTKGLGLFSTCLIGGTPVHQSIKDLKRTNHIVVGTPGRVADMVKQKALKLSNFNVLVLDEFDRMLDMGFVDEMKTINQQMTSKIQTFLFSATKEESQKGLFKEMAGNAKMIKAQHATASTNIIEERLEKVNGQNKFEVVKRLMNEPTKQKTILFCETKRGADKMLQMFKGDNISTDVIHGDKSQKAREIALRKFRTDKIDVLVATDVVARGIDVPDVDLVINYELPRNKTDYTHRIGRTGRAGKKGLAITLID